RNYKRAHAKCDRPRARDDSRAARGAAPRESLERENELPVRLTHRRDRQTIARAQQQHPRELLAGMRAQLFQRDGAREAALQLHVHHEPAGIGGEMLDAEGAGLGLHQPVLHRMIPSSVTTASSSTSCAAGAIRSTCWKA